MIWGVRLGGCGEKNPCNQLIGDYNPHIDPLPERAMSPRFTLAAPGLQEADPDSLLPPISRLGMDRRQSQEDGPPWVTHEGFVLENRRSGEERRALVAT